MKFALPTSFKPGKTGIVLGVAVLIGLVAALGARSYLAKRVADLEAKSQGATVQVIVAKGDLSKGTKLSSATLAVRGVPVEYAHSAALKPEEFDNVDGQTLAYNVKSGEMILWGLIEGKRVPTFSARVEPGRRAITVPVDEINSISGMLEPGDLIDLILTLDQKGKKITIPLLQSVQVMATGQRSVDDPKSGERRQYSTVTLNTAVQDAQNVIMGRESGRLTALLRNPSDKKPMHGFQGDLSSLLGKQDALTTAAGEPIGMREIPVLYGGRGVKLDMKALNMGMPDAEASFAPQAPVLTGAPGGNVNTAPLTRSTP